MSTLDIQPRVTGKVVFGSDSERDVVLAGRIVERGSDYPIEFDGSDDFVVMHVGKRGSGKSYGMASILEAFATGPDSKIARLTTRRAIVLLDPLDIHWPAIIPLRADGPEAQRRQHEALAAAGLTVEPIHVRVFVPAGYASPIDCAGFMEYQLPVSDLTADDWALLLKTDVVTEPRGRLLDEALRKVTELGWRAHADRRPEPPRADYSVADLVKCIDEDHEIAAFYAADTCRSVSQALRAFGRMPLFSGSRGTPMIDVANPGVLSILCLGRLGSDLRTVVATVFVRRLKADRMVASQITRRLALSPESTESRLALEAEAAKRVPRTILAIDEAQILMPSRSSSMARQTLDSFVLEGRNFGLSLWLATQRPKGAISDAAISQIDTFIVHRLSVAEDINAVCGMLQSRVPDKIRRAGREISVTDLVRTLDVGEALISSATSSAERLVIGRIRPRMVAHGGQAF